MSGITISGCQVQWRGFKRVTPHFTDVETEAQKPACGPWQTILQPRAFVFVMLTPDSVLLTTLGS